MKTIKSFIEKFSNELKNYRYSFHSIPEPSYKEYKTSEFIKNELKKLSIAYKVIGETAIVAEIGSGYPVIGARFNMDGLEGCIEQTELKYSAHGNCAHACGHDVELAWAMGIARFYSQRKFKGTVRLVFQPAEEGPGDDPEGRAGGKFLSEMGAFNGLNALFSFHVDPDINIGEICAHAGVATVDAIDFEFHLTGVSSHLSRPHEGVNPDLDFANIIIALYELRNDIMNQAHDLQRSPFFVLGTSQASMGLDVRRPLEAEINTLPNGAVLRGSSRLWDGNDSRSLKNSMLKGLEKIASIADESLKKRNESCGCELKLNHIAIATINDPQVVAMATKAIINSGFKHLSQVKHWKDEAGWTSEKAPVCHGYVGCGNGSKNLHSDNFYPDDQILSIGLEVFIVSIENGLYRSETDGFNAC